MQTHLLSFVYVGAGGCVGAVARYGVSVLMQRYTVTWPAGTLLVNVSGCFLIGVIMECASRTGAVTPEMRLLLATGFCGGFTTMSSFVYEMAQLMRVQEYFHAGWYGAATIVGSCVAFVAGLLVWHGIMLLARVLWN